MSRWPDDQTTCRVDAIGLPIRIHPTPSQWGNRPQAEALLAGDVLPIFRPLIS